MKRIINWTFGSFFRTFGRFLFYIIIGYLLFTLFDISNIKISGIWDVLDVYANTINMEYYNNGLDYISGARFYNWTSSTNYSELSNSQTYTEGSDLNGYNYSVMTSGSVSNFGSNGVSFVALLSNISLITNSYYSTIIYLCYDNNVNINLKEIYTANSYTASFNNKSNYSKELLSNGIDNESFTSTNPPNYCRAISFIYQPSIDSSVLNIRLTSSGSLGTWYVVGTKTEYIGVADSLTSSQVSSIIDSSIQNSDLATANDIQSVNSAIDDLSTDIENMSDDIVNNQNQNTQDIIDNQNANSQAQIDSQKVCDYVDKNNIEKEHSYLYSNGNEYTNPNMTWGITSYIKIDKNTEIKVLSVNGDSPYACFYNTNKVKISCVSNSSMVVGTNLIIPDNTSYVRFSIQSSNNMPTFNLCKNGNQALNDAINDDSIDNSTINDMINSLNQEESSLTPFSDFINLPLIWIQNLFASGETCSDIHLPLPYLDNKYLDLPCMTTFWEQMGVLGILVQTIWIAIVGIRIFNGLFLLTCDVLDPNPDKDMTKLRTWEL